VHEAITFLFMMDDVHPMTGINEVLYIHILYMVKTVSGRDYHPVLNMPSGILLHRLRQDDSDPRRSKRIVKGPSY
jgi:hypothetical protein